MFNTAVSGRVWARRTTAFSARRRADLRPRSSGSSAAHRTSVAIANSIAPPAQRWATTADSHGDAAQAAKILAGALARDTTARPEERREVEEYLAELRERLAG